MSMTPSSGLTTAVLETRTFPISSSTSSWEKLGQAFISPEQVVLLIDEVDKADLEFPNDLLNELDEMSFYIPETNETIKAVHRPWSSSQQR